MRPRYYIGCIDTSRCILGIKAKLEDIGYREARFRDFAVFFTKTKMVAVTINTVFVKVAKYKNLNGSGIYLLPYYCSKIL